MNQNKNEAKSQSLSKKVISTLMSVCTAFPKTRRDLDYSEWQRLEYRNPRVVEDFRVNRGGYQ